MKITTRLLQLTCALIIGTASILTSTSPLYAASPSPTASPKATAKATPKPSPSPSPSLAPSDEETTQKLKERIDKVIEQRRDQVKGVVEDLGLRKRGILAEVQRVTEKTLTIKNRKGSQSLTIGPEVTILRDNKKASLDDIAVGDWVIVLGYMDNEEFQIKRIVASSSSLAPRKFETVIGSVQKISRTEVELLARKNKEIIKFTLGRTTKYQDNQGKEIKRENIETDAQYLIIGYQEDAASARTATVIRALGASRPTASPTSNAR